MNRDGSTRTRRYGRLCALVLAWVGPSCLVTAGQAQVGAGPGTDSVTVIPAPECSANRAFSFLAGPGYRDLWTTAITVPVADLGRLGDGGLTPVRVGGGVTTETLHMRGANGRRYVFRSVRKNSRQSLAEEFWGTPVEAIVQDQLCSLHPTGAVTVPPILDAVGVLHTSPQYLVIPDDPRLAEFREQFAGMLVLFEERPDELETGEPGFAGSDRVVQIENLFEALEDDPGDQVAAAELLKARLIDVLLGDRDRSINNHLWARFDVPGGGHLWRPIPRDRDQVYVRFDGLAKALGRIYDPRLVSFGDEYPDIAGLTRHAWDIDRNLLVGLERAEWDAIVRDVQAAITDAVIAEAISHLPASHRAATGPGIEASLRKRRDDLGVAADRMYETVFRYADIHATDADEVALVEGLEGGRVRVAVHRRGADSDPDGPAHIARTFFPKETREIRLYLHGGDDVIRVEGGPEAAIVLRVVGGGGRDELINAAGRRHVVMYDGGDGTRVTGRNAQWARRDAPRIYSWWVNGRGELDWGTASLPLPATTWDKDRGLVLGLGLTRDRFGFLRQPFNTRIQASFGWAIGRSVPIIEYQQHLKDRAGGLDLRLQGRYSGVEVVRFYGMGNETAETEPPRYYEVHQKQLTLAADLALDDGARRRLSIGPVFRHTTSDTSDAATFITAARPYGTGAFSQAGVRISAALGRSEPGRTPGPRFRIEGEVSGYARALDVESAYGTARLEAAFLVSPASGNPTLAVRAGGRKLWGAFPYSDAAFLGGSRDLRGLREQRYAGDASVHGSAELRLLIARFFLLFPVDFGALGFTDAGRVFLDGEASDAWHSGAGGGIWFAPVTQRATFQLSLARAQRRTSFYMGLGFAY